MKLKRLVVATAAVLAWTAGLGAAADFDGSKLLICANIEAADCGAGQACTKGHPDDFGVPAFIRIDFLKKSIVGPKRTTPILKLEKSPEQLLLQGTEMGYAWSLALDTGSGKLASTLVDRDGIIVLFGACTPL